jgi:predicted PurR-regulated permease PerM
MQASHPDLTRTFLVILIIALLISGSLWTLLPFLSALIWSTTIVVATWPLLERTQRLMGGRRRPAALLMTVVVAAVFVVPFGMAITVLLEVVVEGVELARRAMEHGLRPLPEWLVAIPWVGPRLDSRWQELAASGPEGVAAALRPFALSAATWTLAVTGGVGMVAVHFLLTVVLAAILYASGETAGAGVVAFARRISRDRGERTMRLAAQSVRGVALGVVVTALVQSLAAGVGLWATGVPRVGVLLAIIFVLCIAQLGPLLVLLPAVAWLFWSGSTGAGTVLAVWAVLVAVMDNVLKPILIRRGVDLPLLLLVAGVIGGLISFGVVGLFIGPVILAVTYTLLVDWVREGGEDRAA